MAGKLSDNSSTQRYDRYWPVISLVSGKAEFDIDEIKQACAPERPAFVTRLVNELAGQGWLIRETAAGSYQWNSARGEFSPNKWLDEKLYGSQIKAAPERDRPRERLLDLGADNLKISELLAILIRSGRPGESAVVAGEKLAKEFDGKMEHLAAAGRGELKSISPAIEKTAYCQIMAGIELGRRVAELSEQNTNTKIGGPADAIVFCQRHFARLANDAKQEEFHIVTLSTKNQVIDTHRITVGTLDASLVHPREVFRAAIKDAASSIILVHNHPSGDPTPSSEDRKVTERLTDVGKTLGIEVLDHIVLGKGSAVSIRES
ncbi:MAG: DNA repair protein RadC [Planctomycetota bacterium]|nr:DNA repair protein RadC [Planctomycetota bacterium]